MKNFTNTIVIIAALILCNLTSFSQGISINNDGTTANSSAMLDIKSTSGGLLIPRMTSLQRGAITTPATGLLIFQNDGMSGFYYYTGATWNKLSDNLKTYATVVAAESASGVNNDLCYVTETETYYRYNSSGAALTDDNKYVLSTADGGTNRWMGVAGNYNNNDFALKQIIHLDATLGSSTITDLNLIYYINAAATATTITIPDASAQNNGWFLRIYKESGAGVVYIKTASNQNIDGTTLPHITYNGQGIFIKSDNATNWLKLQDSRADEPVVISTNADYPATQTWQFDYLFMDSSTAALTATSPADLSTFPEGSLRMIFNTGTNRVFWNPNGNLADGTTNIRTIGPLGYLEIVKINGEIKIIREKNISIKKEATDISFLECWLDASQLSGTNGSALTSWTDLKNGYIFNALASEQPTLITAAQNGKNIVRFDGLNDVMNAGDIEMHNNIRGFTIVAVVNPYKKDRMPIFSKYQTTGDNREFAFGNKENYLFEDLTWASRTSAKPKMAEDKFQIAELVWTPGNSFEYYINGVLITTGNANVIDISDGIANLKLGGGDYTGVGFWEGDFAEIIAYSAAVTQTEREELRNNLALKWGIDEIIIAGGDADYFVRDDNTNTLSPEVPNDNINVGTGTVSGGTLNATQLLNAPALATPPASPQLGSIYFDTTTGKLKVFTGSVWELLN